MTREDKAAVQLRSTAHCAEVEQTLCQTTKSLLNLLICTTLTP